VSTRLGLCRSVPILASQLRPDTGTGTGCSSARPARAGRAAPRRHRPGTVVPRSDGKGGVAAEAGVTVAVVTPAMTVSGSSVVVTPRRRQRLVAERLCLCPCRPSRRSWRCRRRPRRPTAVPRQDRAKVHGLMLGATTASARPPGDCSRTSPTAPDRAVGDPHGKAVRVPARHAGERGQAQGLTALKELSARKVALSWKGSRRSS
jgi:hypothetical protein